MKQRGTGEVSDTRLELAGGIEARLVSKLLPGPAVSATLTVMTDTPVYLTQQSADRPRRMELRMASGVYYWAEEYSVYLATSAARGSRQLQPLSRMEDSTTPMHIVFTDDGSPSVTILAGYIAFTGRYQAYESGGMMLRPATNRTPENALLTLAIARETQFGRNRYSHDQRIPFRP
jgi:hypothetical protein